MKIEFVFHIEGSQVQSMAADFERLESLGEDEDEVIAQIFAEEDEELFLEAEQIASAIWLASRQEEEEQGKREAEFLDRIQHYEEMKVLHEEYYFLL